MSGNTLPLAPDARSLGKYEVLCRLSTGGMAEIFLASQRGLAGFRKLVVLKQILPDIRGEEEFVRMFLDEAKVTAAFNHPHIAQVYDLDIAEGELFLSMEFVPGATLVEVARACRQANHPIPLGYSLMAVRDTAVALHYAHTFTDPLGRPSPVIHRDVAEKNIMVTYEGVTKLLDFGIAKSLARASRTAVGMVKGTSGYMSPEQVLGEPLDARSDLFSLGVVLHECLTGMRLFYAKQAEAMMNAVLRCEVSPPSRTNKQVPPELDAIVLRALAKKREDRYASTLEFARALERAVGPLIWHPEQSSELMQRLFADRREQTRQLLMSGQAASSDTTDGTGIQKLLALGHPSEQPTGGSGLPQLTPPPARLSVGSAPTVKAPAPVPAKAPTPPQGAPAVRRPTITAAPVTPPAESDSQGTVRVGGPLIPAPAPKRAPTRNVPVEPARPPPPPPEAVSPPPPPPFSDTARTQPGRPALSPPEHTVRAQNPLRDTTPSLPAEDGASRRAPTPPEPPRPPVEEPARPRVARPTQDAMRASPPPPPPMERDRQTAMARMPVMPPDDDGDSVSVTPPTPRRGGGGANARRRQPAPPPHEPVEPEARTHPVRAFEPEQPDRDTLPANLGDDDLHENTLRGIRRAEPRGRRWGQAALAVLMVLGLGAAAVALGLDGGRVSARLRPLLAQAGLGAKAPAPPEVAPPPKPPVIETVAAAPDSADAGTVMPPPEVEVEVESPPVEPEEKPTLVAESRTPGGKKPRLKRAKETVLRKSPSDGGTSAEDSPDDAPAAEPGLLTLVTEPPSKVFLGGQELGDTPLFKVKLPAGKHVLKVVAVGGDGTALSLPLDIKPGDTTAVRVPLELLSQQ